MSLDTLFLINMPTEATKWTKLCVAKPGICYTSQFNAFITITKTNKGKVVVVAAAVIDVILYLYISAVDSLIFYLSNLHEIEWRTSKPSRIRNQQREVIPQQ